MMESSTIIINIVIWSVMKNHRDRAKASSGRRRSCHHCERTLTVCESELCAAEAARRAYFSATAVAVAPQLLQCKGRVFSLGGPCERGDSIILSRKFKGQIVQSITRGESPLKLSNQYYCKHTITIYQQ